jgi:hypothetical protein
MYSISKRERALLRPEAFSMFSWKLRKEGHWVKKMAKAESAILAIL